MKNMNIWAKIAFIAMILWVVCCFLFLAAIIFHWDKLGIAIALPFGLLWLVPFIIDTKAEYV